jgi:hypothetical protein
MSSSQVAGLGLVIPGALMYRHRIQLKRRWPDTVCGFIIVFGPATAMGCDIWTRELQEECYEG